MLDNNNKISLALKLLDLNVATKWFIRDSKDDFYPDVLKYKDIKYSIDNKIDFINIKSIYGYEFICDKVPKKGGLLRDSIWIHPELRIVYTAILHYLLPKIDHKIPHQIYSYRLDSESFDDYPFNNSMMRWKGFHNDAISACIDEKIDTILITDLSAYYDHIDVKKLINIIEDVLGPAIIEEDRLVLHLLEQLLLLWSNNGYGIPQNIDTSSFLGSLYLYHVDKSILKQRFRYFRWVDDIKICTSNENQAYRALHYLQEILTENRLFISGAKTKVINRRDEKNWNDIIDVCDDKLISDLEIAIDSQNKKEIDNLMENILELFKRSYLDDDKKFRAVASRLLDCCSMYSDIYHDLYSEIIDLIINRIDTHPEKMNTWCDMLSGVENLKLNEKIFDELIYKPSLYNWKRYHLIRLLITIPDANTKDVRDYLWSVSRGEISLHEAYIAIICLGKYSCDNERKIIFEKFFKCQGSVIIKRAVIIAIQELNLNDRDKLYNLALNISPQLKPLIEYIEQLNKPEYGESRWSTKKVSEKRISKNYIRKGVGMVDGKRVYYSLSKSDFSYD
ncbi:RNA-directed DNA polymerase [Photobacterium leiognathi]|uniref:RNA-directed DNA polymerase n=1 Tax=Photobacterium leiognathi TaxID=553611 RepID=UPI00298128A1|nr:RNA-directed DNA polymerase [Photobacterium leiognathi]